MKGIINLILNTKPVFLKVKNGEPLTDNDRKQIINFYLEVVSVAETEE
jgi:gluconate kinase